MAHHMTRRRFCRTMLGAAGALTLPHLGGAARASLPQATPIPVRGRLPDETTAQVAFVKTSDRIEGVQRLFDLLDVNPVQDKTVFLKPNFNSADPPPASTHAGLLYALVSRLQAMGAVSVTVGDRNGMGGTIEQVMTRIGVYEMAEDLGFTAIGLEPPGAAENWELLQPEASHWTYGFPFPRVVLDADSVIQTCCLKTHRFGGHFTLSLKNTVGMVSRWMPGLDGHNFMSELHRSEAMRLMIAELNTAYAPDLVLLDGVEAFVTGGPEEGRRVHTQVMLAGTDRVAIDAVGVALLRYYGTTPEVSQGPIFEQEQIARAAELGLGVSRPEQIVLVTGDDDSAAYAAEVEEILLGADPEDVNRSLLPDD